MNIRIKPYEISQDFVNAYKTKVCQIQKGLKSK